MFEDLVKGLLLLHEKGFITRELANEVVNQVLKNEYRYLGQSKEAGE